MSIEAIANVGQRGWLPADQLRAAGFVPGGPEIDYGMRWGEARDVRVAFAPYGNGPDGYLYARDRSSGRCLLLAAQTTTERVETAWRELTASTASPDGYLALAALEERPLTLSQATGLLQHCVDRELSAYRSFATADTDGRVRFDAAQQVIVARSSRVSAEDLQVAAAHAAASDRQPVIVRYRILGETGWCGRVAGADLDSAAAETDRVCRLAARHELGLQATSVTCGHTRLAAARVPELARVATPAPVPSAAPSLGL